MAAIAFTKANSGYFTGLGDAVPSWRICIAKVRLGFESNITPATQSGVSGTPVTESTIVPSTRYDYRFEGIGWYQTSADSGTTWVYPRTNATAGSGLAGTIFTRVDKAILVQRTPILNVTSQADADWKTVWAPLIPRLFGTARGQQLVGEDYLDDTDRNDTSTTLTLPVGAKQVTGKVYYSQLGTGFNYEGGGPNAADIAFEYDMQDATMAVVDTPFESAVMTAAIDLDTTSNNTVTGTVVLEEIRVDLDYLKGGPIPVRYKGRFDNDTTAVAFS